MKKKRKAKVAVTDDPVAAALCALGWELEEATRAAERARGLCPQGSIEEQVRAALRLLHPEPRRGAVAEHAAPARPAPTPAPPAPAKPSAAGRHVSLRLPADGEGTWLTPADADVQHSQVWIVKTRGGELRWAQLDGYDTERGRKYWRAIDLGTRRTLQVRHVLKGSCPRLGGRRERARR